MQDHVCMRKKAFGVHFLANLSIDLNKIENIALSLLNQGQVQSD